MKNLKNRIVVFILALVFSGCSTSFYRVSKQRGSKAEIEVSPDRVISICDKVSDENQYYMFSIDILDDQNTVISAVQGNNSDEDDCSYRKKSVDRILATGKKIYIAGYGNTQEPVEIKKYGQIFPGRGFFPQNGRGIQLMFVANENKKCYGAYINENGPCPSHGFPIREDEYY